MRRGETIKRLLFHAHRDPTDRNGRVCLGIKDHKLPAHFFEQLPVVFHQAVTGVDVSAGGDGANTMDFSIGSFGSDLLDRHERPAREHPLPFFGETCQVILALTLAKRKGQVCQTAQEEVGDRLQFWRAGKDRAKFDEGVEDANLLLSFCFARVGCHGDDCLWL